MASTQWPSTLSEVRRVVAHWVSGCEADVLGTLFKMEGGLTQTYDNGFWLSEEVPHGVPVTNRPTVGHRRFEPACLVRLGLHLALHHPPSCALHLHFIELNKGRSEFFHTMAECVKVHVSVPLVVERVIAQVKQPSIVRKLMQIAARVANRCDAAAVSAQVCEVLSHPIPVKSAANHACILRYVRDAGVAVFPTPLRQIGVLQYPCCSVTTSRVDHTLFVLLCAFGDDCADAPDNIMGLRAWIAAHEAAHVKTAMQEIVEDLRRVHSAR